MTARPIGKLILNALFVWSCIATATYSLAANHQQSADNAEIIPTPAPIENNNSLVSAAEDSDIISEPCDENGCTYCGVPLCSPPGRFWMRADWLMWWTSGANLPPLVTTSPQGTLQENAGVLGQPNTQILFGNSTVYNDGRAGVRITFGGWLDNCHRYGLEGDWLTLGGRSINYSQSSLGNPILARPFYDVFGYTDDDIPENNIPRENAQLVAFPEVATGTIEVIGNDYFESAGMTVRLNLCCNSCDDICQDSCDVQCGAGDCCSPCCLYYCRTDLLVGVRHYLLGDNLTIHEDVFDINRNARFDIFDTFNTRNEFTGAEIGLNTELRRGRWSLGLLGKIAMGNNHETAIINGTTTITSGAEVQQFSEGIYALATNSGVHFFNQFVMIPQFGVEMGYQVNCRWRAFVGYNVLYWATVMRAGDQIDRNLDPHNFPGGVPLPGSASHFPEYLARQTNFWAQGINVGAEFRF